MNRAGMLLGCSLFVLLLTGCDQPGAQSPPPAGKPVAADEQAAAPVARPNKPVSDWTAGEILQQLLATYRQAGTYSDRAVVRLSFRQDGQLVSQDEPASVAFERPNKLSVQAYQATMKCDGRELRARIDDPIARTNFDGQVLVRPIRDGLKLTDLTADEVLRGILKSRLQRLPIQLELLFQSDGLVESFATDIACERLPDERHNAQSCFRVAVPLPTGGKLTLWVDQTQFTLWRLDYPAEILLPELAGDPSVSGLTLATDLRDAKIGGSVSAAEFSLELPPNAKPVKAFVVPPQPLASDLFGKQPRDFSFRALDGSKLTSADLMGKTAVLVWYHDHPACEATLQQVSLARQRLGDAADLSCYAVATDPTTNSGDDLRRRLAQWQVDLPIVRDLEAFGDKSFHIQVQPTIAVLDKRGIVQIFQPGGNPDLANQLVTIVERLQRGDDLAGEILSEQARVQRQYDELLARGGAEPIIPPEPPEAVIRRASEPKKLRLRPLWTCRELKSPGNLLLAHAGDVTRILAVEGWRTIAEVDASGKLIGRHELSLPQQAGITYLRTASDRSGKRYYLAAAPLAPQFIVLDEQWQTLLAFPSPDQAPLAVLDLAVADVSEVDGTPEVLVASAGDVGLVAVSLAGEVRWRNRAFPNAGSVAMTPPDDVGSWNLLVTGDKGALLPVNRFGHDEPPVTVGAWAVQRLFGASFTGTSAPLVGLATNEQGEMSAVGLSRGLKEAWNYPLPRGLHQKPVEPVVPSQILAGHQGEWWLAGPDGSIHVITEDGQLFDSFYCGAAIGGIAAGKWGGKPVLLIATDDGVAALEVSLPAASTRRREF